MAKRKHSAKCLKVYTKTEGVQHYILIGGRWYYNGRSTLALTSLADKDGFWTNNTIKDIINDSMRTGRTLGDIARLEGPCKTEVYMREWSTNQAFYGVPF